MDHRHLADPARTVQRSRRHQPAPLGIEIEKEFAKIIDGAKKELM
jgi:hypothetical protein